MWVRPPLLYQMARSSSWLGRQVFILEIRSSSLLRATIIPVVQWIRTDDYGSSDGGSSPLGNTQKSCEMRASSKDRTNLG